MSRLYIRLPLLLITIVMLINISITITLTAMRMIIIIIEETHGIHEELRPVHVHRTSDLAPRLLVQSLTETRGSYWDKDFGMWGLWV